MYCIFVSNKTRELPRNVNCCHFSGLFGSLSSTTSSRPFGSPTAAAQNSSGFASNSPAAVPVAGGSSLGFSFGSAVPAPSFVAPQASSVGAARNGSLFGQNPTGPVFGIVQPFNQSTQSNTARPGDGTFGTVTSASTQHTTDVTMTSLNIASGLSLHGAAMDVDNDVTMTTVAATSADRQEQAVETIPVNDKDDDTTSTKPDTAASEVQLGKSVSLVDDHC